MLLEARTQGTKYQWVVQPDHEQAADLARQLKVSRLLSQVLINRGIDTASLGHTFLRPKLTELLRPELMPGVVPGAARIKRAIEQQEKITLYGDYDVDGITGVSILLSLLTQLQAQVDYYIPHRIDEGYGLNDEAIRSLAETGVDLVITTDCGISAVASARLAAELGLDLIITDHHQFGPELPPAQAIVHPLLDESYPNPASAGAMVAFKLAWAVANAFSETAKLTGPLRQFMLDATNLTALGTVADMVDLRGENRILTSFGLKALPGSELVGIQALIESAGLTGQGLDSLAIGFKLGPMLNAAGRMGHARLAVELLASDSPTRSRQIAEYLKEQNTLRQQCGRKIFKEACQMVVARGYHHPDHRSIVLAGENWHRGVLGIVASRIVDKYYRPTIVANIETEEGGIVRGSARSIPGFCILDGIKACSEHLVAYGGHEMAAGVTIKADRLTQFIEDFEAYAVENLKHEDVVARLNIDAEAQLGEFSMDMVKQLQLLEPCGQGNPKPIFMTKGVRLLSPARCVGARGDHLQLAVTDNSHSVRCIGFGMGKLEKKLLEAECFNIAYEAQINSYNGNSNVQFVLADVQI